MSLRNNTTMAPGAPQPQRTTRSAARAASTTATQPGVSAQQPLVQHYQATPHQPVSALAVAPAPHVSTPLQILAVTPASTAAIPPAVGGHLVIPLWTPIYQEKVDITKLKAGTTPAQIAADTQAVIDFANSTKGSELAEQIVTLTLQRGLVFRAGKNGRQPTNYVDPQSIKNYKRYNDGCVGFSFGDESPTPCKKCANGDGPFPYCVVVTINRVPLWGGACMCCRAHDHEKKCSLYRASVPGGAGNGVGNRGVSAAVAGVGGGFAGMGGGVVGIGGGGIRVSGIGNVGGIGGLGVFGVTGNGNGGNGVGRMGVGEAGVLGNGGNVFGGSDSDDSDSDASIPAIAKEKPKDMGPANSAARST